MSADDEQCAVLTRIAAWHPDWRVSRGHTADDGWRGWVARRGAETVTADSLLQLEVDLSGR